MFVQILLCLYLPCGIRSALFHDEKNCGQDVNQLDVPLLLQSDPGEQVNLGEYSYEPRRALIEFLEDREQYDEFEARYRREPTSPKLDTKETATKGSAGPNLANSTQGDQAYKGKRSKITLSGTKLGEGSKEIDKGGKLRQRKSEGKEDKAREESLDYEDEDVKPESKTKAQRKKKPVVNQIEYDEYEVDDEPKNGAKGHISEVGRPDSSMVRKRKDKLVKKPNKTNSLNVFPNTEDGNTTSRKEVWDEWTEWSRCSVTCGEGVMSRWRHCIGGACTNGKKRAQIEPCFLPPCGTASTTPGHQDQ